MSPTFEVRARAATPRPSARRRVSAIAGIPTDEVASACRRLTGDPGRKVRHGTHFRVQVTSSDGERATVVVEVDTHRRETRPYVLSDIGQRWRLGDHDVLDVLENR